MISTNFSVMNLGRTSYVDALARQRQVHERRKAGLCSDTLILTEHEPVLTLGRNADRRHILAGEDELQQLGIDVVPVERGGNVTYHGPGQVVAYPIVDLGGYGRDIRRYVGALEASAIRLLQRFGVEGERRPGTPGVWAGDAKIASVGVFVSRWVTLHGIAINIDPDLSHFDLIEPCGLVGVRMTSLARELGRAVPLIDVEASYMNDLIASLDAIRSLLRRAV
ncbi:MAG: lipoyl(octanoyl) transferase LipB [Dehalococcoidia bacterium]